MKAATIARILRWSAVLTLVGLVLMVWSVLQPTPLPTILAMSLGQVVGTAAFAMYLIAIALDLRDDARARRDGAVAPVAVAVAVAPAPVVKEPPG